MSRKTSHTFLKMGWVSEKPNRKNEMKQHWFNLLSQSWDGTKPNIQSENVYCTVLMISILNTTSLNKIICSVYRLFWYKVTVRREVPKSQFLGARDIGVPRNLMIFTCDLGRIKRSLWKVQPHELNRPFKDLEGWFGRRISSSSLDPCHRQKDLNGVFVSSWSRTSSKGNNNFYCQSGYATYRALVHCV